MMVTNRLRRQLDQGWGYQNAVAQCPLGLAQNVDKLQPPRIDVLLPADREDVLQRQGRVWGPASEIQPKLG